MTMTSTVRALLSGRKICAVTMGPEHDWLLKPENARRVDKYLAEIDFSLSRLGDDLFWLVDIRHHSFDREQARLQIRSDYRDAGPLVAFLELVMRKDPDAGLPKVGDQFRLTDIITMVETNTVLTEDLLRLSTQLNINATYSLGERLRAIAHKLTAAGYLALFDRELDIWVLTGQIGYFHRFRDIVQRVAPDFGDDVVREIAGQQGDLF